jgi:hypothetical protein
MQLHFVRVLVLNGIPAYKGWVRRTNSIIVWEDLRLLLTQTEAMHLPPTNNTVYMQLH